MRNTFFRKQYAHGFTLVELIVVIVILGILTLASGTAYIATLRTSRDGRRKIDMENIKQALEAYHSDNSSYPDTDDGVTPLSTFLDPAPPGKKYLSMPKDPKSGADYQYREASCETINLVDVCNSYDLSVVLENPPDNVPAACSSQTCVSPLTNLPVSCSYCLDPYGPLPTVPAVPTNTPTPTPMIEPGGGDGGEEGK